MKTKNINTTFPLGIILFLLLFSTQANCQLFVNPHAGGVSSFNKNDLHLAVGMMSLNKFRRNENFIRIFHSSIGWSPLKHLDVKAFYSSIKHLKKERSENYLLKSYQYGFEIGGYYNLKFDFRKNLDLIEPKKKEYPFYANVSIGSSWGNDFLNITEKIGFMRSGDLDFQKIYIHLGMHWKTEKLIFSYFYKRGNMIYAKGNFNGKVEAREFDLLNKIRANNIQKLSGFTFRTQFNLKKWISIYGQITQEKMPDLDDETFVIFDLGIVLKMSYLKNN